uniref:Uncharacterized protein n=1 Tax=Arundo donax TaxID=35708 RepID=A0A0A9CX07_ARUDO
MPGKSNGTSKRPTICHVVFLETSLVTAFMLGHLFIFSTFLWVEGQGIECCRQV